MEVYGVFRNHNEKLVKQKGEIVNRGNDIITVSYNGYYHSYIESDVGKTLFYTENEAEEAIEELRRRQQWS